MQMTTRCSASMPHISNNLSRLYLLPHGDADAGAMRIQGFHSISVIQFHMVSVTTAPTVGGIGDCYGTGCSSQDGSPFRSGDVGTAMVTAFSTDWIGAIPKRRSNVTMIDSTCVLDPISGHGRYPFFMLY